MEWEQFDDPLLKERHVSVNLEDRKREFNCRDGNYATFFHSGKMKTHARNEHRKMEVNYRSAESYRNITSHKFLLLALLKDYCSLDKMRRTF